eukprot:gene8024-8883_t
MTANGGLMQLKFAANLSFLFQDVQRLPNRYIEAKKAGFLGVECADPYSYAIDQLVQAKRDANVEQILITSFRAVEILKELDCPNIKLLLDLYHHQMTSGNITNTLSNTLPLLGHIQISQVPDRNEPDKNGELNYNFIFNHLLRIGYDGWIGCEYIPKGKLMPHGIFIHIYNDKQ